MTPLLKILAVIAGYILVKQLIKIVLRRKVYSSLRGAMPSAFMDKSFRGKPLVIENALELCMHYRLSVPDLDSLKEVYAKRCLSCEKTGKMRLYRGAINNSPFLYHLMIKYHPYVYKKSRRRLPEDFNQEIDIHRWTFLQYRTDIPMFFCSRECIASFIVWNLYLPTNARQRILRPLFVTWWFMKRYLF